MTKGLPADKFLNDKLIELFDARVRRKIRRGLSHRFFNFINKVRKSKKSVEG